MLFKLKKKKLRGILTINSKSIHYFFSFFFSLIHSHSYSKFQTLFLLNRANRGWHEKKVERVFSVSPSLETSQIDRSTRYHVWNGVRELLEGEAEGECARSSEIISWCPLQATKEEERKRTGLSQSFLDTRRSFYCEKLAG